MKLAFHVYDHNGLVAMFACEIDACEWAKSRDFEVVFASKKGGGGLIAQYQNTRTTEEFESHERARGMM